MLPPCSDLGLLLRGGARGVLGRNRGRWLSGRPEVQEHDPVTRDSTVPCPAGISSPVKKTEMDKSPFHSPSPQDSPRLSSFTQHHRPVIAVHSGGCSGPWAGGGTLLRAITAWEVPRDV